MKLRKMLGAICALAVTASAFAGFGVTADAAETALTKVTYEDATGTGFTDLGRGATSLKPAGSSDVNTTQYVSMNNSGSTKGSAGWDITPTFSENLIGAIINFDFLATDADVNSKHIMVGTNAMGRIGSDKVEPTGAIFSVGNHDAGTYYVNGTEDTKIASNTWVNVSAVADFTKKTVDVTIKNFAKTETLWSGTVDFLDSKVSTINRVVMHVYRGLKDEALNFDNFEILECAEPKLTLSNNSVTTNVGGQSTVNVTDVTGTVSVATSDNKIATAEYSNGVVTITGIADGEATISVTATNDGIKRTQDITAVVGNVEYADVTVKYMCNDVEVAPAVTTSEAVESVIESVDYEAEIIDDDCKYVFDSISTLPYTVVDGENVITVNYTRIDKFQGLTVNYKNGSGELIQSDTITNNELYVGDTLSYTERFYVSGNDGKIYANNGIEIYSEDTKGESAVSVMPNELKQYVKSLKITEVNMSLDIPVSYLPNSVYFTEGENLSLSAASNLGNPGRFVFSNGYAKSGRTSSEGVQLYTIPEDGDYQIIITGGARRARPSALFISAEAAATATEVTDENAIMTFGIMTDNAVYGMYNVKTVSLKAGDVLTVKGFYDSYEVYPIDYILVRKVEPSIVMLNGTTAKAVELTDQEVTPADGGDAITVSGTAYTIWYKLTGFDEGAQTTITLKDSTGAVNETATITQAEVGTDGYYCVQILDDENLEAGSYTVTLTAGDVTSEAVTFTAK